MKLCNRRRIGYPAGMSNLNASPLIARLRASTRLAVMVLLVFLMKVGMVVACSSHDFDSAGSDGNSGSFSSSINVDGGPNDDGKAPDPLPDAGCVDCHCHHAAALTTDSASLAWIPTAAEPAGVFVHRHLTAPSRELRPPIA